MKMLKGLERGAKRLVPNSWRKYFRASKYELLMTRLAPVSLIVHVGAHWGEDAATYEAYGAQTVLWVEADPDTYQTLVARLGPRSDPAKHLTHFALVSKDSGESITFNRFNGDGASSSVYRATDAYRARFPNSIETGETLTLQTMALSDILRQHDLSPQDADRAMLVLDVQGHELVILQGLADGLKAFDLCKCEVSRTPMYDGAARFEDIDRHFVAMGFRLVSHFYALVPTHGDVLYQRID
jgi:FkbM family methyltransferase